MNTAGTSGSHETDMFNRPNTANETGSGTAKETGKVDTTETRAPHGASGSSAGTMESHRTKGSGQEESKPVVIEVLTQEQGTGNLTAEPSYFAEDTPSSGLRWWLIPAIAVPVAAGATAATILVLRQRRQRALHAAELAVAAKATRNLLDTLRLRQTLAQANALVQRSRGSVQNVPPQASFWRDLVTDPVAAWRDLLGDSVKSWRTLVTDSVNGWRDVTTGSIGSWRDLTANSIGSWRDLLGDSADRWRRLAIRSAQPYVNTAKSQALATRASASSAVNSAGKTVSGTVSHTLAFSLGALITAATTYVVRWRQRMLEADTAPERSEANQMREQPIL